MEATTTLAEPTRAGDDLVEGTEFTTRARTITEADVVAFAGLTGDFHPQHTDAVYAADSMFGERVAHGMLVLSYAVGLVPFPPERVVALRRIGDVRFLRPVRLGDTVAVRVKIGELRPIDTAHGILRSHWTVVNQHGKPVVRAEVEAVWRLEA